MSARPDAARPDWASGPEWEGWSVGQDGEIRRTADRHKFTIYDDGVLEATSINIDVWLGLDSPADALEIANLIAEKLGGWGE